MSASRPERHLDPDAAGSPLAMLPGLTDAGLNRAVAVVVGPAAAATARGQLLTWVTVNLLLRCYGALDAVTVSGADIALIEPLPTLHPGAVNAPTQGKATLGKALSDLGAALADPTRPHPKLVLSAAAVDDHDDPADAAATLLIGTELLTHHVIDATKPTPTWLLSASNWKATVVMATDCDGVDVAALPQLDAAGTVMVAAWFAAAVGVGEAFKVVGRLREGSGLFVDVLAADLWNGVIDNSLDALAGLDGPSDALTLPAHWVVGAGAVGEAYLAVLSTSEVDTDVAALDPDDLDERNLNRHLVAAVADLGIGKALLAERRLSTASTRIASLPYTWQGWVGTHPDDKPPLAAPLADQSRAQRYGLVISAVDKNDARTALAGSRPEMIFSASTKGLNVEVGRYGRDSPWQCLGCASPIAPPRTVEQAAAELTGRSEAELAAEAARVGANVNQLRAYLDNPVCGTLGEREMAKFAAFTRPDWSVSFVSVAAGVLLAARVLRHAHGLDNDGSLLGRDYPAGGDTARLWMAKTSFGRTAHQRRQDCPICSGVPGLGDPSAEHPSSRTW